MILLSHPTGNTFSRALLAALLRDERLGLFATTISIRGDERWLNLLPGKARSELLRRKFDAPAEKVFSRPYLELQRLALQRLGIGKGEVDSVYRDLDTTVARKLKEANNFTGIYAYEDGALESFRTARELGVSCFYDLPIAYWETGQRLLKEEVERWPQWEKTMPGLFDSGEKLQRKTEEMRLADLVICPSQFVLKSVPAEKKCVVAEFGSPIRPEPKYRSISKKLRILFAGSMTQRKGLADIFAAMRLVKRPEIELVVMGTPLVPMEFYRREFRDFVYERPRAHAEVLELMATCDALLLPSIVEGRALVQQEAMACGLIVIATANAGAEDLLEDGSAGFLVPIRSPETIAARLEWLIENRAALAMMKRAAFEKAGALTWERYGQIIVNAMENG